jgi:hypothetical protein
MTDKSQIEECPYPKGDIRRLFLVLAAIDALEGEATLLRIVEATGINKGQIADMVEKARNQLGVRIDKTGPVYRIRAWGKLINRDGVRGLLRAEKRRLKDGAGRQ